MTTATDKTPAPGETGAVPEDEDRPLSGLARIRAMDKWQRAGLMAEAAYEGNKLCDRISRTVTDAYVSGSPAVAGTAVSTDIINQAAEACRLLSMAAEYLRDLTRDQDEPPF